MNIDDYHKAQQKLMDQYSKDEKGMGHLYDLDISDMVWFCSCGALKHSGDRRNQPCRDRVK